MLLAFWIFFRKVIIGLELYDVNFWVIFFFTKLYVSKDNIVTFMRQNMDKALIVRAFACCEALYKCKMCAPLKRQRVGHCALGRVMPIASELAPRWPCS